ncbi:MAG: TRAP transporter substrate-binding protein [Negativicutes bacterium]|nr:TRAP transporter substrate-binding protein [Negativicutes bacterium]
MRNNRLSIGIVLIVFLLAAVVAGCGSSTPAPAAKSIVLKAADVQPADYPTSMGLKQMAKLLDERTKGRIKMEVYPGAQLGDEKETIEMTQLGTIAINRISASPLIGFNPQMGVFSMPYIFRDSEHEWKVLDGPVGKGLLKELEKSNLIGLAYYDSGARSFYTKKPVNSPDDLKGMKIRVQQSKVIVDMVNTLGASATPMGYGEVYSGLQSGLIDGAENNPPSLWTMKHYEVCKYYTLDEHMMIPEVVLMSKKVWDSLSPEDQKLMAEVAAESVVYEKKLWAELTDKSLKDLKANGITVNTVNKEPFRKAVAPMYEKYPEYKTIIEQIQAVK